MCLPIQNQDRRNRFLFSSGMFCLVLSLLPQVFDFTVGLTAAPLHFLRGFFLGLALVLIPYSGHHLRKPRLPSDPIR
jgi:hypothetical protein